MTLVFEEAICGAGKVRVVAELARASDRYEDALRSIGRHLDEARAYAFTILEIEHGFVVTYHSEPDQADLRTQHFSWLLLDEMRQMARAQRGQQLPALPEMSIWGEQTVKRQNYLRALGHGLDAEQARSIVMDEVPSGVAVSYLHPGTQDPQRFAKRHTLISNDDIALLAADAERRRSS